MHLKAEDILLSDLKQLPELKLDSGYMVRLECDEPTPEVQEIARKELRENPDIVRESLQALKDLIKEDKELDAPVHSEAWLYRFLRPTKFYPESAYKLVKNYYQFKEKHKNVYDNLKPSNEKNVFSHDLLTVLPKRDQGGRRILILHLGKKWKHNKVCLDEIYKGAVLFLEAAMLEPESQICGAQVIFDMDGMSLQQTWQFTPPFAKRIVDLLQDCIALRIKGLHIVNQPYIFNMVFALFKPFLRDKLRSRIIFHGTDRKSLHDYLSAKCLPECYGGTLEIPRITGLQWFEPLCMLDKEYEAIGTYGCKKKPKK